MSLNKIADELGVELEPFCSGMGECDTVGAFVRGHDVSDEAFRAAIQVASADWTTGICPEDIENIDRCTIERRWQRDEDDELNEETRYIGCAPDDPGAYPVTIVRWD